MSTGNFKSYARVGANRLKALLATPKSPKINNSDIISFIREEYGNDVTRLLSSINGVLSLGNLMTKNPKHKNAIKTAQVGIGAALFGYEIYSKIKNHADKKHEEHLDINQVYSSAISKELVINEDSNCWHDIHRNTINMDEITSKWILGIPNSENFKINKICNLVGGYRLVTIGGSDNGPQSTLSELNNISVILFCNLIANNYNFAIRIDYAMFGSTMFIKGVVLMGNEIWDFADEITTAILKDYVKSLDPTHTIIKFDNYNLKPSPRRECPIRVNQFDVEYFVKEMREVLQSGRRRAVVLAGRQGVGKSSIIRYIEANVREHMIFHLNAADFSSPALLKSRFDVMKAYQPVILVIEDIDSCNMERKNEIAGTFLECIDEVNKNLNIFIIVTVNDTSKIHPTIIDRPGRFDRIYEVKSPQSPEEVEEDVMNKINVIKNNYFADGEFESIQSQMTYEVMQEFYKKCVDMQFTQAEITEAIVEQSMIDFKIIDSDHTINTFKNMVMGAIDKHIETKQILRKYYNVESDPMGDDLSDEVSHTGKELLLNTNEWRLAKSI